MYYRYVEVRGGQVCCDDVSEDRVLQATRCVVMTSVVKTVYYRYVEVRGSQVCCGDVSEDRVLQVRGGERRPGVL